MYDLAFITGVFVLLGALSAWFGALLYDVFAGMHRRRTLDTAGALDDSNRRNRR